ncbi:MAG TPA: HAMP domain-containing protein [Candidatus Onthocola gallistercoris]|uniref:histidine kinase n=1 Tax=Candidatus Onthocola gallistercoris TaxID=2840876 RepID=A0A9D1KX15_9FIRM|nr:HAMP domain-containing protein [Candidatus Onthocola gallistercoris]
MQLWLIVALIVVTISPLFIMRYIALENIEAQLRSKRMDELSSYALILSNQIMRSNFFAGENQETVNNDLTQSASLYNARILIVNSAYKIVKDNYSTLDGTYSVSEETIRAMNGEEVRHYNEEDGMLELAAPITSEDKQTVLGVLLFYSSTSDIVKTCQSISSSYTAITIGLAVLCVVLAVSIAYIFIKPLKRVTNSIDHMAEGHFDEEIHLRGFSELKRISDSFNTMLNKLRKLENSRQEFVSNVSHELKTPITSIKVLADSLNMQENVPNEVYKEFMHDIVEEIDRENSIINDLLSLVKMDKAVAELNISEVDINEMLELILKRLRPIASQRNIELVLESFRPVMAECDEVKMNLAFTNLVENGIKYNVAGGWVQVSLNADHKYFYVKVADSGIGIPEEYQDQIFERFYRVDKARSRETGGTGLGLAITQNIVLMHDGAIKVNSKEDEGSVFVVRIPLKHKK